MAGPFICYRELISPSCIDNATFIRIQALDEHKCLVEREFLVTLTSSSLSFYQMTSTLDVSQLVLASRFDTYGKPQDIAVISMHSKSQPDNHIVVSFDKGKIVILKYNMERCKLDVLYMFNGEFNAFGKGADLKVDVLHIPNLMANFVPRLAVDCRNELVCSVLYGKLLSFVDFRVSNSTITSSKQKSKNTKSMNNAFIVYLDRLGYDGTILDVCFLAGYKMPTIALMQEKSSIPIGHYARVSNTVW